MSARDFVGSHMGEVGALTGGAVMDWMRDLKTPHSAAAVKLLRSGVGYVDVLRDLVIALDATVVAQTAKLVDAAKNETRPIVLLLPESYDKCPECLAASFVNRHVTTNQTGEETP
jgi:hypothetical protein